MSESILQVRELKAQREGTRVYLLLKDGSGWIRAEVAAPLHFAREFYKLAVRADEEAKSLERILQSKRRVCGNKP